MLRPVSTAAMFSAALVLLSALVGCTDRGPEGSPPPPVASTPPPADAPVLMGGPRDEPPAAPEPPAPVERPFTAMAPVANPEDMSPEERARVYGPRYDRPDDRRHWRLPASSPDAESAGPPLAIQHHLRRRHHGLTQGTRYAVQGQSPEPKPSAASAPAQGPAQPETASSPPAAPAQSAATATPAAQAGSPNLDWLSIPGAPTLNVPGFGRVPSQYITGAILLAIAIALLAYAARRGQTAPPPRRPARETVGAGPTFADERLDKPAARAEEAVAPFPHNEDEHLGA